MYCKERALFITVCKVYYDKIYSIFICKINNCKAIYGAHKVKNYPKLNFFISLNFLYCLVVESVKQII